MSAARSIYHLARSDFLERIRRYSFLLVLGLTVYAGYMCIPPLGGTYTAFVIGGARGFYDSPWVGLVFGNVVSTMLPLLGFYLVKDSVERDVRTGVGQILAATPLNRVSYVVGKWLSNLAVLASILGMLTLVAPLMQILRAEDTAVDLWAIAAPIWLMGLPIAGLTAAIAVLFECVPWLRGGLGSVAYVFLWLAVVLVGWGPLFDRAGVPYNDVAGLSRPLASIREQMVAAGLDPARGTTDLFEPTGGRVVARFAWSGLAWTAGILFERLTWMALALGMALAAAVPFDRFGSARPVTGRRGRPAREGRWPWSPRAHAATEQPAAPSTHATTATVRLTPLGERRPRACLGALLVGELRLMLRGHHRLWRLVALGLLIATLAAPMGRVLHLFMPVAWLWPLRIWSAMGSREERFQTGPFVLPMIRPLRRQWLALWLAGVVVGVVVSAPAALRRLLDGQWDFLGPRAVGGMVVPALALALGAWTRDGRLFEIVYVVLWFVGPFAGTAPLDFMGTTPGAVARGYFLVHLVATCLLLGLAVLGRRRQLRA